MKKFLIILLSLPLLVGCNEKKEELLMAERDKIVKFLTSSRHLIAESDLGSSLDENPPFYSTFGQYAYRYIVNYYDADRETKPVVNWGDKIEIRFNAYTFTGSEPSTSAIYFSNVPEIIEQLGKKSDYTLSWSKEPLQITLGSTSLIKGLEHTLPGCHEADSVQVFMTSNLAYGDNAINVVPKNSMVAWYMKIEKVLE
jgi:hypothetical protein